jgi:predicted DCC family thiol-disulfide oxidoreductase YuxK
MKYLDTIPKTKKLILFDGVCNLCNNAVLEVIKYDKKNVFLFAAIQSKTGETITKELGIDVSKLDSILLYVPDESYYSKSTAALKIAKEFSGYWKILQIGTLLPDFFNDFFYDYIARNRYKWFGRKEKCMIPTPSIKAKFFE